MRFVVRVFFHAALAIALAAVLVEAHDGLAPSVTALESERATTSQIGAPNSADAAVVPIVLDDTDGDGYTNVTESGSPLCSGEVNDDNPDDALVNDGCPAVGAPETGAQCANTTDDDGDGFVNDGCPQVGAFSEAQFNIGTNPLSPCSVGSTPNPSPSWPSDFVSGGIPDSTDRVTITDLTSFLAPVRHLDSSPGNPNFNSRWDLIPGRGLFSQWININDLTALLAGSPGIPPMLGGAKAYGGPKCSEGQFSVNHIVVLMQENRSFDHYFGHLHDFDPTLDVEPEPASASNPDPTNPGGPPIQSFHQTKLCEVADLAHSWNAVHNEWDSGQMDGFTSANIDPADPTGSRSMGYYTQDELPFYYGLYDTFAIGDRYFSSLPGPTFPNRFYVLAGTSFGHIRNDLPSGGTEFSQPSIFSLLDQAGVSWKIYYSQVAFAYLFADVANNAAGHVVPIDSYFTDAQAGNLPQVAFIDPIFSTLKNFENDEHPPANVQVGEKFVADVIGALFTSPNWMSSALFLTYDEHGGYYDHVAPPAAPVPDAIPPMLQPGDVSGAFDRYGIRVPVAVVSPFAKGHFVSHVVHDHTSVLRFIENHFGLPALTNRDAASDPMLEFFDFANAPFPTPPPLPAAPVDMTRPECS